MKDLKITFDIPVNASAEMQLRHILKDAIEMAKRELYIDTIHKVLESETELLALEIDRKKIVRELNSLSMNK